MVMAEDEKILFSLCLKLFYNGWPRLLCLDLAQELHVGSAVMHIDRRTLIMNEFCSFITGSIKGWFVCKVFVLDRGCGHVVSFCFFWP